MTHRSSLTGSRDDVMGSLLQEDTVRDPLTLSSDVKMPSIAHPCPPPPPRSGALSLHLWVKNSAFKPKHSLHFREKFSYSHTPL